MDTFLRTLARPSAPVEPDYERLAQLALASSGFRTIRELSVERHDGALVLNGQVSTFYQKQIAQELVKAVAGSLTVLNEIEVP